MIKLKFIGQCMSGKNNMIVTKQGKHIPKQAWAEWRDGWVAQAMEQRPRSTINKKCAATVYYWPGDLIRRDVPGIMDALWHVLERGYVVTDDTLICNIDAWVTHEVDRLNPRIDLRLRIL